MAIQIDVVVVVIDRVDENTTFIHFVGMLVGSCFKRETHLLGYWEEMSSVHSVIRNAANKKRDMNGLPSAKPSCKKCRVF